MSRKANDLLAELRDLGLTEGVSTTVKGNTVSLKAGNLTAGASDDDPDVAFEKAVIAFHKAFKGTPTAKRPKAWEATTRTTADHSEGDRVERKLTKEDFA